MRLRGTTYHRRRGRWAKIAYIDGPVDLSPSKYSVALGVKAEALARGVHLTGNRYQAGKIAQSWLDYKITFDNLLVTC
jgi:hypothetical protein